MRRIAAVAVLLVLAMGAGSAQAPVKPAAGASQADRVRLSAVDGVVAKAIADKQIPGAVLLVGRGTEVLYQKAYGNRAIAPAAEPMTLDTIFDMASVTKVVATTTSVMILVEDGKVRLNDRVATFIPDFGRYGKGDITVRHLLTHVSGLRPDLDLSDDSWNSYDEAIRRACEEVPTSAPGERFVYSDINFFLLADIVARVSGMPFDRFVEERVFKPLGMTESMFTPPASLKARIAPTEACSPLGWPCSGPDQVMLRGIGNGPASSFMTHQFVVLTDGGASTRRFWTDSIAAIKGTGAMRTRTSDFTVVLKDGTEVTAQFTGMNCQGEVKQATPDWYCGTMFTYNEDDGDQKIDLLQVDRVEFLGVPRRDKAGHVMFDPWKFSPFTGEKLP